VAEQAERGRLIVVGTGIRSIAQLTQEAVAWIKAADIVCYALADPVTQRWVRDNAKAAEDLGVYYDESANRLTSYDRMAARLVAHARAGRTVVGAFYGHPGIFTDPSHQAVAIARSEGIEARMLPGISAEDCLFADLGVDPGLGASESYEATEMLVRGRRPDTTSHVVIWQIGVLAQQGFSSSRGASDLQPLVDYLLSSYPADHLVTHYQGSQLVLCESLVEPVALGDLGGIRAAVTSTLYVPPLTDAGFRADMAASLGLDGTVGPGARWEVGQPFTGEAPVDPGHQEPDWYQPLAPGRSRVQDLIVALAEDPELLAAFEADPGPYVGALGLDPIEIFAVLTRNAGLISLCVRCGTGTAAAVAGGMAATEAEAASFRVAADGRLMRPRVGAAPRRNS
jgi:siroheme synthase